MCVNAAEEIWVLVCAIRGIMKDLLLSSPQLFSLILLLNLLSEGRIRGEELKSV